MVRPSNLLTALKVRAVKEPGKYADGNGLYLRLDKAGNKTWVFIFTSPTEARRREMGMGSALSVTLEEARRKADAAREHIRNGIDPSTARRTARAPKPETQTFGKFADDFVDDIKAEWRNSKHAAQWKSTLGDRYCKSLRALKLDEITSADVMAVLQPIWREKAETASRLRGRIERVLDAAKAQGLRQGDNPAVWRGGLKAALPKRHILTRGHHRAIPHIDIPDFMEQLRPRRASAASALEFLILAAARSGEVRGARWHEMDTANAVWIVPGKRMKAGREHRVPLTPRMLEILKEQAKHPHHRDDLVFQGLKGGEMSDMTMANLVKRMGFDATVHGFRSSFRDWAADATDFPREIAEAALAHSVGDATERAYRRGDALDKRRLLMEAWAHFACSKSKGPSRDGTK